MLNELVFKCWRTDEHGSRYVFRWGWPSGWVAAVEFYPPRDDGSCYEHRRDPVTGGPVRVDYAKRSWRLSVVFLFRGFELIRVRKTPKW